MEDFERLRNQLLAELENTMGMGGVMWWQRKYAEPFLTGLRFEGARFRADDQLIVPALMQAPRQQHQLLLASATSHRRMHVTDPHRELGRRTARPAKSVT